MNRRHLLPPTGAALVALLLAGCGGGGGGGSSPPPSAPSPPPATQPAPTVSYTAPPAFKVGTAITVLSPTTTGSPSAFSASPSLPAGLVLNATTGAISGTPTVAAPPANYQISATNSAGTGTASISITVNDIAPVVSFAQASYVLSVGVPVNLTPSSTGGAVTSWSIDRTLPAGMAFSSSTGTVSGTPTQASAASTYRITANNSGGTASFDLALAVATGAVYELGHAAPITALRYSGNRILSVDNTNRIVLWNAQTGAILLATSTDCATSGSCPTNNDLGNVNAAGPYAALGGGTAIVRTRAGWNTYSTVDGSLIGQFGEAGFSTAGWQLATDGSYVLLHGSGGLHVRNTAGSLLVSKSGSNYLSQIRFFTAPNEVRIANVGSGSHVIETISVPSGTSSTGPLYAGTFSRWLQDGSGFLTGAGNTVMIHSPTGVQLAIGALPKLEGLDGFAGWVWTRPASGPLNIYSVGGGTLTLRATYATDASTTLSASGSAIAIFGAGGSAFSVIDLSGAAPTKSDYASPFQFNGTFAAISSTDWVFGGLDGVLSGELIGSTPQLYASGTILSIAGSDTRIAVALSQGGILVYDGATRTLERRISFNSSHVELSKDGTVLAAAADDRGGQYFPDRTLRVYSLPSGTVLGEWSASYSLTDLPVDFSLAPSGDTVARTLVTINESVRDASHRVERLNKTLLWNRTYPGVAPGRIPVRFGSTGNQFAAADGPQYNVGSNIIINGTLTAAAVGWPLGWTDDTRLVVNRYEGNPPFPSSYRGADIVDERGHVLASPLLAEMTDFQVLGGREVYDPKRNLVVDVTGGSTLWSSPSPAGGKGGVAAGYVYFLSNSTLRAEAR